ncbi:TonB family protein [Variovorax sp. 67-131]|uniref:energy transducer TonB n=2 Tax=unclassified Variovorax TaxID=663243 RepID=UPI0008688A25|nr:MAG: hypothetical protein ABS94_01165 [Variovorax sp. SCN 67-85]
MQCGDGMPRDINIATSSRYERLDEAALGSVRRTHFFPARSPLDAAISVRPPCERLGRFRL